MVYEKVQTTSRGVVGFVFFQKEAHDLKIFLNCCYTAPFHYI